MNLIQWIKDSLKKMLNLVGQEESNDNLRTKVNGTGTCIEIQVKEE